MENIYLPSFIHNSWWFKCFVWWNVFLSIAVWARSTDQAESGMRYVPITVITCARWSKLHIQKIPNKNTAYFLSDWRIFFWNLTKIWELIDICMQGHHEWQEIRLTHSGSSSGGIPVMLLPCCSQKSTEFLILKAKLFSSWFINTLQIAKRNEIFIKVNNFE